MKKVLITIVLTAAGLSSSAQSDTIVVSQPDSVITTAAGDPQPQTTTVDLKPAAKTKAQPIFGYLSYDEALKVIPQYAIVEKQMADLRQAYDTEMKRVEDDFNQKYEAFLDGRKDFPRTILLKRQTELQQLLQRNLEFKAKSLEELEKARHEAMVPLQGRLAEVIAAVARRHKLALVVNTDSNACPFIEPALSLDLNQEVQQQLIRGR